MQLNKNQVPGLNLTSLRINIGSKESILGSEILGNRNINTGTILLLKAIVN